MSLRSRCLGRLATLGSNRKFVATRLAAARLGLVAPGNEPALARANAVFVWSYYLRFARLCRRRGRARLYRQVAPVGEERLADAASHGRGLILLSLHLGDFDIAGGWLAERHGVTPVVVSRAIKPRWRDGLFSLIRRRCGIVLRDADRTGFEQLESDLDQGRAILVMLDRLPPGRTVPSSLLGGPAVVPLAAAALAARTGAPLLPAATWRDAGGRPMVWFGEPRLIFDARRGVARIIEVAEQLGSLVREHPEQWHVPADLREMACGPLREAAALRRECLDQAVGLQAPESAVEGAGAETNAGHLLDVLGETLAAI